MQEQYFEGYAIREQGNCPGYGTIQEEKEEGTGCQSYRIGTGSRRRQTQAMQLWDNVVCEPIRGNVDTRLRKLQEGVCDGILLAKAGLDRLEIGSAHKAYGEELRFCSLNPEQFLPAACQGIIAVEAVQGSAAWALCRQLTDKETELCFLVEREALARLSADCSEAAAAWCRWEQGRLVLDVMYAGNRQRLMAWSRNPDEAAEWKGNQKMDVIKDEKSSRAQTWCGSLQRTGFIEDEHRCMMDVSERKDISHAERREDRVGGQCTETRGKDICNAELQEGLRMARRAAELVKGKGQETT